MSQGPAPAPEQPATAYPPAGPPRDRGGAFGLGVAGTVLGSIALLWLTALTAVVLFGMGGALGWVAYGNEMVESESEPEDYEPPKFEGSLGPPGPAGYDPSALTAAINEALGDYYGVPIECPPVPSAIANDLPGRAMACTAAESDWVLTILVVFSDDQGRFSIAVY